MLQIFKNQRLRTQTEYVTVYKFHIKNYLESFVYILFVPFIWNHLQWKVFLFLHLNIKLHCCANSKTITTGENAPWVPSILSCSLTYCFSFFSVIATKSFMSCIFVLECFNCSNSLTLVLLSFLFWSVCIIRWYNQMEIVKRWIATIK